VGENKIGGEGGNGREGDNERRVGGGKMRLRVSPGIEQIAAT